MYVGLSTAQTGDKLEICPGLISNLSPVCDVGLSTAQTGDKLEISPGQTMDLELQSCVSVEAGKGQMPSVWSLDDSTGLWVQSKADLEVEGVRMPTPSEASTEASESDLVGERRAIKKGGKRKGGKKKKMD